MPRETRYIVITGGVLSGLGKGVALASIGMLFSESYTVAPLKLDGYLNTDPGTMNPVEHGEVFVLEDGTEVDMDFGHYERFVDIECGADQNLTMGKVYETIRKKERRGDYLGQTVQLIPHVTDHILEYVLSVGENHKADIVLVEVGGTVGDMENELFVEALRQLPSVVGRDRVFYAHMTYVPIPVGVNEQKTKPTQQSVALLNERGIRPDAILGRCEEELSRGVTKKISKFTDVPEEAVFSCVDVDTIYRVPEKLRSQEVDLLISDKLGLPNPETNRLSNWNALLEESPEHEVHIVIAGKYTDLEDSYASVVEAIHHAARNVGVKPCIEWIDTSTGADNEVLRSADAVIVPGGFGTRGIEGKIEVIRYARENKVPFIGLCYGLQLAVVEYARNVCGLQGAHTTEVNPDTPHPVISMLDEQRNVTEKGGTMRLGGHPARVSGVVAELYADRSEDGVVSERHRHRYEVNPAYVERLEEAGLRVSGRHVNRDLVEFIELPGQYFVASQAHPELTSKLEDPAPLFKGLLEAAAENY